MLLRAEGKYFTKMYEKFTKMFAIKTVQEVEEKNKLLPIMIDKKFSSCNHRKPFECQEFSRQFAL